MDEAAVKQSLIDSQAEVDRLRVELHDAVTLRDRLIREAFDVHGLTNYRIGKTLGLNLTGVSHIRRGRRKTEGVQYQRKGAA